MLPCISSRKTARRGAALGLCLGLAVACFWFGNATAIGGRRGRGGREAAARLEAGADSIGRAPGDSAAVGERVAPPPGERFARRKTKAYDLVKMGENVRIGPDEVVRGDVVVLGGNLRVDGEVVGDAVVVGGSIAAGPQSSIGGEAVAVGGRVEAAPGADVRGGVVSLNFLPAHLFRHLDWTRAHQVSSLVGDFLLVGFLIFSAALFHLFIPRRLRSAASYLETSFLKCFVLGILGLAGGSFAAVVAIALLAITLIGIPLALLLAFLCGLLLVAALLGGALLVGEKVCVALRIEGRSQFLHASAGILTLLLPKFLADTLNLTVSGVGAGGFVLHFASAALVLTALSAGLGALILTKLGAEMSLPSPLAPPPGSAPAARSPTGYEPFHETKPPLAS